MGNKIRGGSSPHSKRGQTTTEYAVIAALALAIVAGLLVFASAMRGNISEAGNGVADTFAALSGEGGNGSDESNEPEAEAFAVFSADDGSLDFYKREGMPKVGDVFEGKTASAVYTGFEEIPHQLSDIPWDGIRDQVASIDVVDEGVCPQGMHAWFYNMTNLETAQVAKLDTSRCVNMGFLFSMDNKLSFADVGSWDTSSCTSMQAMFGACSSLTSLDVSHFNTGNVRLMQSMFNQCQRLSSLDTSAWNTSLCRHMGYMFSQCSSLASLDVSRFDTGKVASMNHMFYMCESLESLDLSGWDTSSCTDMEGMFAGYGDMYMKLRSVGNVSGWDMSHVTTISSMFQDCELLESVGDISGWNLSSITGQGMWATFNRAVSLSDCGDLSKWGKYTGNLTSLNYSFRGTGHVKTGMSMDLSGVASWDVSSVNDFGGTFENAAPNEVLDLSGWQVQEGAAHDDFATGSPNIVLPAVWQ